MKRSRHPFVNSFIVSVFPVHVATQCPFVVGLSDSITTVIAPSFAVIDTMCALVVPGNSMKTLRKTDASLDVEYVAGGNSKRCPNISLYAETLIMTHSFFVGYEILLVMLRLSGKYVK